MAVGTRLSQRKGRRWLLGWPAAVGCTIAAAAAVSGCGHRIDQQTIFDELTTRSSQSGAAGRATNATGATRTEYPEVGTLGPRVEEFPGRSATPTRGQYGREGVQAVGGSYEVGFNDADLSEVVRVILREALNIGYVLSPAVKGKVTISAPRALSRSQLLEFLEAVLQMNQAVMIKQGDSYRIEPSVEALPGGEGTYAADQRAIGPGFGVTAYPLKYVASSEMLRLLSSFAARPGSLRAGSVDNWLLIRGSSSERTNLVDLASTFDVDWLRGQSAGIYRLAYAAPDEIIKELTKVFQTGEGGVAAGVIRFEPIKRLNAVLVLTQRERLLKDAATWIARLDRSSPLGDGLFVYRVEHAKATRLADVINKIFADQPLGEATDSEVAPGERIAVAATRSIDAATASPRIGALRPPTEGAAPVLRPTTLPGTGALPDEVPPVAAAGRAPGVDVRVDRGGQAAGKVHVVPFEAQNKLVIRASPNDYKKILQILQRLDRPQVQVLINATLAEVQLNKNLRYGVQAFLQETNNTTKGVLGFSNGQSLTIQPSLPGLNFLVGLQASPKIILDALSAQTSVRLVSSPSLVVTNNETATLQVGDDVPIATRQAVSVSADPLAPVVNSIEFRKTGVILNVTPQINSDGLVTMQIEQEVSAVAQPGSSGQSSPGSSSTLTPTISQRRVVSTISVYSGQMVVLGGLVTERASKLSNRVPVLEHVPVIGDVVGKTDDVGGRTELVVFIQPRVIRDASEATAIADELRDRFSSLAPDDRRRRRVLEFDRGRAETRDRWNATAVPHK